MDVDEALSLFDRWQSERKSALAYQAGFAIAEELRRLRGEASNADTVDAGRVTELEQSLAELCNAIGIAPNPAEAGFEYVARVKSAMEQPGAAPSEGGDQGMADIHLHFYYPGQYTIPENFTISNRPDESMAGRFDELKAMLTQRADQIMHSVQESRDILTRIDQVVPSFKALIDDKNARIAELQDKVNGMVTANEAQQAELDALFDQATTTEADFQAALQNTPADPSAGGTDQPTA